MSDPLNPSQSQKRETKFASDARHQDPGSRSWFADQYSADHYLVPEEEVPIVHQERLFSRRVLFGWAFATLIVVFAVTVILPMVEPLVKEAVIERVAGRMHERRINITVDGSPDQPTIPDVPPIPAMPPTPASPNHTKTAAPATSGRR